MKKSLVILVSSVLLLSGCGTYTGSGAYVGGSFGSVFGSAIGGLAGGPRGSDIGTIVGMAGGAVLGAAVGNQADQQQQQRTERRHQVRGNARSTSGYQQNEMYSTGQSANGSGFDASNSGDDRLYGFNDDQLSYSPNVEIANARFVDANQDNKLNRNETCKIIFEVMNRGKQAVYDVVPTVVEVTGNKHICISPSIHIEKIEVGEGIRYTAMVKADSRLKEGNARFCVSVVCGGQTISKVNEFNIPTTKY